MWGGVLAAAAAFISIADCPQNWERKTLVIRVNRGNDIAPVFGMKKASGKDVVIFNVTKNKHDYAIIPRVKNILLREVLGAQKDIAIPSDNCWRRTRIGSYRNWTIGRSGILPCKRNLSESKPTDEIFSVSKTNVFESRAYAPHYTQFSIIDAHAMFICRVILGHVCSDCCAELRDVSEPLAFHLIQLPEHNTLLGNHGVVLLIPCQLGVFVGRVGPCQGGSICEVDRSKSVGAVSMGSEQSIPPAPFGVSQRKHIVLMGFNPSALSIDHGPKEYDDREDGSEKSEAKKEQANLFKNGLLTVGALFLIACSLKLGNDGVDRKNAFFICSALTLFVCGGLVFLFVG